MGTLNYIVTKYDLNTAGRLPIEIPNVNREDLARLFHELGFTAGAEVGVEQGRYSEVLCRENPGLHLHCVDAWRAYKGYREHVSQSKLDGFFEATQERLSGYTVTYHRGWSVEVAKTFNDSSLDFVYIDANHEFKQVCDDLYAWLPKVKPGGIISGHDYIRRKSESYLCQVVELINGYTQAYHVKPWFVLGTKAVVGRRDRPRSWMWVKE